MTTADYVIVALVLISMLIGIWRGFVRETLGLATWLFAAVMAWLFAGTAAQLLTGLIAEPSFRLAAAGAGLFLFGLLVGTLITSLITRAVRGSFFSGADRTLGAGMGLLRGLALAVLGVWLLRATPVTQDSWWRSSRLIPPLERVALAAEDLLPRSLRGGASAVQNIHVPAI